MAIILSIIFGILIAAGLIYYFFLADRGDVYERAMAAAARGDYMDARAMIRSRIDRDSGNPRPHYFMSRIYAMEGDRESELSHLNEVLTLDRFSADLKKIDVLMRVAEVYYDQGEYRSSFQKYMDVLEEHRSNEEALARLAFLAAGQGEYEIAELYFKDLVRIAPSVSQYRIGRGVALTMLRKKEALEELEEGMRLAPGDLTAIFLTALVAYKQNANDKAGQICRELKGLTNDPVISFILNKLSTVVYYRVGDFGLALESAENCLEIALDKGWESEEYDSRLAISYMAILSGDLEKANDHLLELEMQNPTDDVVIRVSDYRMDVEEGIATIHEISPRGFDFNNHLREWARSRFPDDAVYKLSGLRMEDRFDISSIVNKDGKAVKEPGVSSRGGGAYVDNTGLIEAFNVLPESSFISACEKLVQSQGYSVSKKLPRKEIDGADFIASKKEDKKIKALFSIRQWSNQPISDIFIRNMQNTMNELKVQYGFVIAGARLTPGAEQALQNLKKISVINEQDLGNLLQTVLK